MELVPQTVKSRAKVWVYGVCAGSTAIMLLQLLPLSAWGSCSPGSALCAERWCTVSGDRHIAWDVRYNGLLLPVERFFGIYPGFPTYMIAAFALPLIYGAWRFVLVHAFAEPILATALTSNPNEMPAIWCLFSIAILLISLSSPVRRGLTTRSWWGWPVERPF
jgi:phage shock protein PspC (stress-responsive transcriptional regulator)